MKLNYSNIHDVKVVHQIDRHFNFSQLGIQVLSISKRIMNEVMNLVYDLGCKIYYQDTYSFMIERYDIHKISTSFKEKYSIELISTN